MAFFDGFFIKSKLRFFDYDVLCLVFVFLGLKIAYFLDNCTLNAIIILNILTALGLPNKIAVEFGLLLTKKINTRRLFYNSIPEKM